MGKPDERRLASMSRAGDLLGELDLSRDGRQVEVLPVPASTNRSAYGVVPLPVAVLRHGEGPCVLLTGGCHGDEYEGQLALGALIRELAPEAVRGTLIILPSLNLPAGLAGCRNSPIDDRNLNRSYPGEPDGTVTDRIAHLVVDELLPRCDAWIDLHSGGVSLDFAFCVNVGPSRDPRLRGASLKMAMAFGAPFVVLMDDLGGVRTSLAAAARRGIPAVTTELGGAGCVSSPGLELAKQGTCRALHQLGALASPPPAAPPPRVVEIAGPNSYLRAPHTGVFEPLFVPGDAVRAGDPAGRLHFLETPAREPATLCFPISGIALMRRAPAITTPGDCLALVGSVDPTSSGDHGTTAHAADSSGPRTWNDQTRC